MSAYPLGVRDNAVYSLKPLLCLLDLWEEYLSNSLASRWGQWNVGRCSGLEHKHLLCTFLPFLQGPWCTEDVH